MRIQRSAAVVLRQYYILRGSPARVVSLFAWIVVDMILWGFLSRYLNTIASPGYDFVPALLGAVLLWDFFVRVMHGVAMTFFEDVWSRNFLNIFASPMSLAEYTVGLVLSSIATSVAGLVVMLLLAMVVFGLPTGAYGFGAAAFLLVLLLFGIALGIVATAMVLRVGPAAEWLTWPIPAAISPFAGVLYPVATLPAWMQWIGRILPPTYVFEGLRAAARGEAVSVTALALSGVLALGYVGLAAWFFQRVYRHAVRTGLIARYSAESIS